MFGFALGAGTTWAAALYIEVLFRAFTFEIEHDVHEN